MFLANYNDIISPLFHHTRVFLIVFGIIAFIGGLVGFVKAQSTASLIAGGVSGVLLIVGAVLIPKAWQTGVALDLIVSLALLGRFGPALFRGKYNPAAYIVPFGIVGVVLTLMCFLSPAAHP